MEEIDNVTYDTGNQIVFLVQAPILDMATAIQGKGTITIPSDAMCGLFNGGNGSGSLLGIKLEKDITGSIADMTKPSYQARDGVLEVFYKDGYRYNVDEVYGLVASAWNTNVIISQVENPKNESIKESQELKVGDIVNWNNVVWVKINSIHGNKANVSPIHKEDIDSSKFEKEETVLLNSLRKSNEYMKEDSIDDIVNSLINKYGKEKLQKGLQTPYQKDYIWGLLHREKGLDLTTILNCLKSRLSESINEDMDLLSKDATFRYMMLDRLRMDSQS